MYDLDEDLSKPLGAERIRLPDWLIFRSVFLGLLQRWLPHLFGSRATKSIASKYCTIY
jgi:hypothetical protein